MATTQKKQNNANYADYLAPETEDVVPHLWMQSPLPYEVLEVPIDRIISREVHEAEKLNLWSKVWQFACHETHIPEVGDQYVYDICDRSYLIVRTAPDTIKAYVNACLHRGRTLRDTPGHASDIRCPYHSFTWSLDGSIKSIPCAEEFLGRTRAEWSLPEIQVDSWQGFIFINPDPDAEPLQAFLGDLDAHFARWDLRDRVLTAHAAIYAKCNWKIAQEAFMEGFHVSTTHPQSIFGLAGERTQYDVFGNFSRAMSTMGVPSGVAKRPVTEQEALDSILERTADSPIEVVVPPGSTARQVLASNLRERLRGLIGEKAETFVENELADIFYYTVFPNFHPWGAFNELIFRFRPNGDDHETSIMELFYMTPAKPDDPRDPAPVAIVGFDEAVADVPGIGALGRVFDQDIYNLPNIQRGLRNTLKKSITLSAYQETKIRHFYMLHEQWTASK